jgi:hypothetical protein
MGTILTTCINCDQGEHRLCPHELGQRPQIGGMDMICMCDNAIHLQIEMEKGSTGQ